MNSVSTKRQRLNAMLSIKISIFLKYFLAHIDNVIITVYIRFVYSNNLAFGDDFGVEIGMCEEKQVVINEILCVFNKPHQCK